MPQGPARVAVAELAEQLLDQGRVIGHAPLDLLAERPGPCPGPTDQVAQGVAQTLVAGRRAFGGAGSGPFGSRRRIAVVGFTLAGPIRLARCRSRPPGGSEFLLPLAVEVVRRRLGPLPRDLDDPLGERAGLGHGPPLAARAPRGRQERLEAQGRLAIEAEHRPARQQDQTAVAYQAGRLVIQQRGDQLGVDRDEQVGRQLAEPRGTRHRPRSRRPELQQEPPGDVVDAARGVEPQPRAEREQRGRVPAGDEQGRRRRGDADVAATELEWDLDRHGIPPSPRPARRSAAAIRSAAAFEGSPPIKRLEPRQVPSGIQAANSRPET